MLYRIDYENFIVHMIDHFPREEILHMQYAIISATICNEGHADNMVKLNDFYPDPDIVVAYSESHDKNLLRKMYLDQLNPKDDRLSREHYDFLVFKSFLNPILAHRYDVCIVCSHSDWENDYIDILCEYLKEKFSLEVIDLNQLFEKGYVNEIYIDRSELHNRSVDVARAAVQAQRDALESTRDGRAKLVAQSNKKWKLNKLEELGINHDSTKMEDLDELLRVAYVEDED